MLTSLKTVHAELRDALSILAEIASRPRPNDELLAAARLRLTRLSRRRNALIETFVLGLLGNASARDARAITDLRDEITARSSESSQHIGHWTLRAIGADWTGYQRASAEMRRAMLQRIDREAALLYPQLESKPLGNGAD